jgi:hypothetical protein
MRRGFTHLHFAYFAMLSVCGIVALGVADSASATAPAEMRAIARDAYIYGFPLIENYRIQYSWFIDTQNPEYKGPWNTIHSNTHAYTPNDTAMQTPNADALYSVLGADLRAEPLVISVPEMAENRYYSLQFIDMQTATFAYVGTRTTGNHAGTFLLAGPNWHGAPPPGIAKVIHSETQFATVLFRTQLFNPKDLDHVRKIQAAYKVQTLSAFLGKPAPPVAPAIGFRKPLGVRDERSSPEAFNLLSYVLQFCPTAPDEKRLMERFARINVGAGKEIAFAGTLPEKRRAYEDGMADAWEAYDRTHRAFINGKISSGDLFGTRALVKGNYIHRMVGAADGIYRNAPEEAIYLPYSKDQDGHTLTGANDYVVHFDKDKLPPVNAFWSLTLYGLSSRLLVANPLNRYLINSPMLPELNKDADGGITLYIQHESPGKSKESNWLPAPEGTFAMVLRAYWPEKAMLDGQWHAPQVQKMH